MFTCCSISSGYIRSISLQHMHLSCLCFSCSGIIFNRGFSYRLCQNCKLPEISRLQRECEILQDRRCIWYTCWVPKDVPLLQPRSSLEVVTPLAPRTWCSLLAYLVPGDSHDLHPCSYFQTANPSWIRALSAWS